MNLGIILRLLDYDYEIIKDSIHINLLIQFTLSTELLYLDLQA